MFPYSVILTVYHEQQPPLNYANHFLTAINSVSSGYLIILLMFVKLLCPILL